VVLHPAVVTSPQESGKCHKIHKNILNDQSNK